MNKLKREGIHLKHWIVSAAGLCNIKFAHKVNFSIWSLVFLEIIQFSVM